MKTNLILKIIVLLSIILICILIINNLPNNNSNNKNNNNSNSNSKETFETTVIPNFDKLQNGRNEWYFTNNDNEQIFIMIYSDVVDFFKNSKRLYAKEFIVNRENDISTTDGKFRFYISTDGSFSVDYKLAGSGSGSGSGSYSDSDNNNITLTAKLYDATKLNNDITISGKKYDLQTKAPIIKTFKERGTINGKNEIIPIPINSPSTPGIQSQNIDQNIRQCSIYSIKHDQIDMCNGVDKLFYGIPLYFLHERTLKDMFNNSNYTSEQKTKIKQVLDDLGNGLKNGVCKLPIYDWWEDSSGNQLTADNADKLIESNYKLSENIKKYSIFGSLDNWAYCFANDGTKSYSGSNISSSKLENISRNKILSKMPYNDNNDNKIQKIGLTSFNISEYHDYMCNKPIENLTLARNNIFNNAVTPLTTTDFIGLEIDTKNMIKDIRFYKYNTDLGTMDENKTDTFQSYASYVSTQKLFTLGMIKDLNGLDPMDGIEGLPSISNNFNTSCTLPQSVSLNNITMKYPDSRLAILVNSNVVTNYMFRFDEECNGTGKVKFIDENTNYLENKIKIKFGDDQIISDLSPSYNSPYYGDIEDIDKTIQTVNNLITGASNQMNYYDCSMKKTRLTHGVNKFTLDAFQYIGLFNASDKDAYLGTLSNKKVIRPSYNSCKNHNDSSTGIDNDESSGNLCNLYIGYLNVPTEGTYSFNVGSISTGLLVFGNDIYDINELLNGVIDLYGGSNPINNNIILGYNSRYPNNKVDLKAKDYLFVFIHDSSIGATIFVSPPFDESGMRCNENGPVPFKMIDDETSVPTNFQDIAPSYFYTAEVSWQDYILKKYDLINTINYYKQIKTSLVGFKTDYNTKVSDQTKITNIMFNILKNSQTKLITNTFPPIYISKMYTSQNQSKDIVFLSK
jgi:hypothetical protein